jgi:Domain of unknown function (DUF4251)
MFRNIFQQLLAPFLMLVCVCSSAQSGNDQREKDAYEQLKNRIDSRHFQFHALSATPMKGRTIQLTSEYTLKLKNDSLFVDLPYYGRSYTADYGSADVSVRFNSGQFRYSADSAKKGGWEITIVPKNESSANKITMSITSGSYCFMNISSNTRQPITYYGTIEAFKDR